jgi:hypothetical protein
MFQTELKISAKKVQANKLIVSSVEGDTLVPAADFNERQRFKQLEDELIDIRVNLDSSWDIVESMLENYKQFLLAHAQVKDFMDSEEASEDLIVRAFQARSKEVKLLKLKLEALQAKAAGNSELVWA